MREVAPVALLPSLRRIDAKEPQTDADVLLGAHPEEVLLLVSLVKGLHHHSGRLRGVDDVCEVLCSDGIAAVGLQRILEVDAVELRQFLVAGLAPEKGVVDDLRQVRHLEVI